MVIALEGLWLAAILLAFYLAAKIILTPAIVGVLHHIPAVGRFLTSAADAVVTNVENAVGRWVKPHLVTLLKWMAAATLATTFIPAAVAFLAVKVEGALKHLVETKIMQMVHAVTNPIVRQLNRDTKVVDQAVGDIAALDKRLTHSISQGIRDLRDELVERFRKGIDRLRSDVYDTTVPALEKAIGRAAAKAEADVAAVGRDVTGVVRDVADLTRRLDVPLKVVESLIASVGIVAALDALETLGKCSPKLRTLCTYDPSLWDDFLLGILALIAFPGLREMTLMGADALGELSGSIEELARS